MPAVGVWGSFGRHSFLASVTLALHWIGTAVDAACSCDLKLTQVTNNNLGGLGPDDFNRHWIRYKDVCTVDGGQVDLVIEADGDKYESKSNFGNGVSQCGPYGSIAVRKGTSVKLKARLLNAATDEERTIESFILSFYDLDLTGAHHAKVTVLGFAGLFLASDTNVEHEPALQGAVLQSPEKVEPVNCPKDPLAMSRDQENVAASMVFRDTSSFSFTLEVLGKKTETSHNFLFGGAMSLKPECDDADDLEQEAQAEAEKEAEKQAADDAANKDGGGAAGAGADGEFDCHSGKPSDWLAEQATFCCDKLNLGCEAISSEEETSTPAPAPPPDDEADSSDSPGPAPAPPPPDGSEGPVPLEPVPAPEEPCGPKADCDLDLTKPSHSNLGGLGPDKKGAAEIRYQNVCAVNGEPLDFVLEAVSPYKPHDVEGNGASDDAPSVNLKMGTSVNMKARLVKSGTNTLADVPSFYFSILNLVGKRHASKVTVHEFDTYFLSGKGLVERKPTDNGAIFKSVAEAEEGDEEATSDGRTVSLLFAGLSEFTIGFAVTGQAHNQGRDFIFGGKSSLVRECSGGGGGEPPAVLPAPGPAPGGDDVGPPAPPAPAPTPSGGGGEGEAPAPTPSPAPPLPTELPVTTTLPFTTTVPITTTVPPSPAVTQTSSTGTTTTPLEGEDGTYDCHSVELWTLAKTDWCCEKEQIGCPTTTKLFDCTTTELWPLVKSEWCCENEKLGCPTTTKRYDCTTTELWTLQKRMFCCQELGVGCPTTTTFRLTSSAPVVYDCASGYDQWQAAWSSVKKEWCCSKTGLGCESGQSDPFDCQEGVDDWELGWSTGKKTWCCEHQGFGCSSASELKFEAQGLRPSPRAETAWSRLRIRVAAWGTASALGLAALTVLSRAWSSSARGLRSCRCFQSEAQDRDGYVACYTAGEAIPFANASSEPVD